MGVPARHYSWEPFAPGHTKSLQHGAYSERRVAPVAQEILDEARRSPDWPGYLNDESYAAALVNWARSEAMTQLLFDYLAEMGIVAGLTDVGEEEVTETREQYLAKGKTRRVTKSKRTAAAIDLWRKVSTLAMTQRDKLGLSPLARSRIGRDVAMAQNVDLAQLWARSDEELPSGDQGESA